MATVSDIKNTPLSGLNYIDALLDTGPDWNYLTPAANTIAYTFSVASGNEQGQTGQQAFSQVQQNAVRGALAYISQLTGIQFTETTVGTAAQIHFANIDIDGAQTTGLCSWTSSYTYSSDNTIVSYDADAYVYLDNVEWQAQNSFPAVGTDGYETLLHELGHALGLKHPFLEEGEDPATTIRLPASQDNTANTLMSYTESGAPRSSYSQYDIAALNWLYGGDGLGGLGVSSPTGARYLTGTNANDVLTGTSANDTLEGDAGNDTLDGGAGSDTAVFRGAHGDYLVTQRTDGSLQVSSTLEGSDILKSIELLKFTDGIFQAAQLVTDITPPAAPTLSVSKNAAGYAMGNSPLVTGSAEANSTVKVYSGDTLIGTTQADASGLWSVTTSPFRDGMNYAIFAKATDASGNTSDASASVSFNVDATAPTIPTATVATTAGSNQVVFSGTGEAGTMIQVIRLSDATEIARTTVKADRTWHIDSAPLPNGSYDVGIASVDAADNATSAAKPLSFAIDSVLNTNGTANAETFKPGAGNNAIDGGAGLDLAVYSAPRANFTIAQDVYGFAVTDTVGTGGHDTLVNVERLQFSDNTWVALDINGTAGQAYRMYQAAFDRVPDLDGLGFWIRAMDNGYTLNQIAGEFIKSNEFQQMYMSDPSDANFINKLYQHVLHRTPDDAGMQWWLDNVHNSSRAEVLAFFTESPENQAQVIGSVQGGITYTHWS